MQPKLKIQLVLTKTNRTGSTRSIPTPLLTLDQNDAEELETTIGDETLSEPKIVDLSETNNITALIMWAVYKDADVPNGIEAGDIAPFLVERNGTGIWEPVTGILMVPGGLTDLKYKKANEEADTKKLIVTRIICANGA